jgi:ABC-type ATPase involved in cell division
MKIEVTATTAISQSARVRQLEGMFDCPAAEKQTKHWTIDAPIEDESWSVGFIVGPSGAGKSTVARKMFGDHVDTPLTWGGASVIDDFAKTATMNQIADVCRAVGFNTIPAWMRPFGVLSTGEKFRVELARRLLELGDPIVVDEFTSVVDRQVAQIGSAAVAKYVRKHGRKFVAVGCHYDVIDWLQPDWIIEPHTETFTRRSVRRRPTVDVEIVRCHHSEWKRFAPYHYMSASLNHSARCFMALVGDVPAAFLAVLYRPHPRVKNVYGVSRSVTLPDWQGLGISPAMTDIVAAAYKACGKRLRHNPMHPALVHMYDQHKLWSMEKRPGVFSNDALRGRPDAPAASGLTKQRACAVFEYRGPPHPNEAEARELIGM